MLIAPGEVCEVQASRLHDANMCEHSVRRDGQGRDPPRSRVIPSLTNGPCENQSWLCRCTETNLAPL